VTHGSVEFEGMRIDKMNPQDLTEFGIVQILEGRQVFENFQRGDCSNTFWHGMSFEQFERECDMGVIYANEQGVLYEGDVPGTMVIMEPAGDALSGPWYIDLQCGHRFDPDADFRCQGCGTNLLTVRVHPGGYELSCPTCDTKRTLYVD